MNKLFVIAVAVIAFSFTTSEADAQFYGHRGFGGSGFSISVGNGFNHFGYGNFNRGFGRPVSGVSLNIGNAGFGGFNRGFYGGGIPYRVARPVIVQPVPVYRGFHGGYGGGFYRRGYGCGW